MRINRSGSIDNLVFTAAVTVASRSFILRDRFLGRVKRDLLQNSKSMELSRRSIASGQQVLDAVFVNPVGEPARAAVLLCHGIGETVDHWFGVQKLLAAQGVASLVFDYSGYGRSTGQIQWKQCEQDAIEAFGALKVLFPNAPASILGFSLGSGIAAAVLDRVSPQKLILCSSFTSFQDAVCCAGLPQSAPRKPPYRPCSFRLSPSAKRNRGAASLPTAAPLRSHFMRMALGAKKGTKPCPFCTHECTAKRPLCH